jgi:tetratricopeptide (TPR) repeat protein
MKCEWDTSFDMFNRVLNISEEINDEGLTTEAYHGFGKVYWRKGESDKALNYLNKCLMYYMKVNNLPKQEGVYQELGNVYLDKGECRKARELYNKSMRVCEKLGNKYELARLYNNIGVSYSRQDLHDKATRWYEKQIKIADKIGYIRGVAYGISNVSYAISQVCCEEKDLEKALDYCEKAMGIFKNLGDKDMIGYCHVNKGIIFGKKNEWGKAVQYFNEGLCVLKKSNSLHSLASTYFDFAKMYKSKGDLMEAKKQLQNALKCYEKLENKEKVKKIRKELVELTMKHRGCDSLIKDN